MIFRKPNVITLDATRMKKEEYCFDHPPNLLCLCTAKDNITYVFTLVNVTINIYVIYVDLPAHFSCRYPIK